MLQLVVFLGEIRGGRYDFFTPYFGRKDGDSVEIEVSLVVCVVVLADT